MFEGIVEVFHRELATLEEKYAGGKTPMTEQDLMHIDTMAHALKCMATYEAMLNSGEKKSVRYVSREYEPPRGYYRY